MCARVKGSITKSIKRMRKLQNEKQIIFRCSSYELDEMRNASGISVSTSKGIYYFTKRPLVLKTQRFSMSKRRSMNLSFKHNSQVNLRNDGTPSPDNIDSQSKGTKITSSASGPKAAESTLPPFEVKPIGVEGTTPPFKKLQSPDD